MELGIKDRVALITGASSGLGLAAAEALSVEGAKVILNSRSQENLETAADKVEKNTGVRPHTIAGDLTGAGESERIIEKARAFYNSVDILVSNAGGPPSGDFMTLTKENWTESAKLTLYPAIDLARAVIPGMMQKAWGRIIFITSLSVKQPAPGLIISNTLRAGVTGFAKSISNELAAHGITVNTVCPGFTRTERLNYLAEKQAKDKGVKPEDIFKGWMDNIPAGRLGEPSELASLICFLASEKAAYITGTSIPVDGGYIKGLL
jgi:3-oxoacyl-[acyl-carrier protein] reductase